MPEQNAKSVSQEKPPEVKSVAVSMTPDQALATVNAVIANDTFIVTSLAIFLAILGVFGVSAIVIFARTVASKLADKRLDAYLKTDEGSDFVRKAIRQEVRSQIEEKIVVYVRPDAASISGSQFPSPPGE